MAGSDHDLPSIGPEMPWGMGRSPVNLERRIRLHRLDAVLDELEGHNLNGTSVLSAGLAAQLDELGIFAEGRAPVAELIERVLAAQTPFMIQAAPRDRRRAPRSTFDLSRLRL